MASEFKLKGPLPKYRSTETLVQQLIEHITTGNNFNVGDRFLSDNDLVIITGRSRTAVRRALSILSEGGWIRRKGGSGTFIGEKLAEYKTTLEDDDVPPFHVNPANHPDARSQSIASDVFPRMEVRKNVDSTIRIAVAVSSLISVGTPKHYWYHDEILDGVDEEAAIRKNIIVEFLGKHGAQMENLLPRQERNSPDIFLCIGPPLNHVSLIGASRCWDIPCALAAIRAPELGLSNFYEDSVSAARDAVKYLAKRGHERIGFIQVMNPSGWWAFDRYEGYLQGMKEHGLEQFVGEGLWLPMLATRDSVGMLKRYLKRNKITALLSGCYWAAGHFTELMQKYGIRVPEDISFVTFDQNPIVKHLLGGKTPTTINLPWRELGRSFVKMARSIINRECVPDMMFPCELVEGETVQNI